MRNPMARTTSANTKGRKLLKKYLESSSQAALARTIGVGQQTVSEWAKGSCRPDAMWRAILERAAGIPVDAWFDESELKRIANAAA
jgi:transcriptional regulator with XRE-family HTH domain